MIVSDGKQARINVRYLRICLFLVGSGTAVGSKRGLGSIAIVKFGVYRYCRGVMLKNTNNTDNINNKYYSVLRSRSDQEHQGEPLLFTISALG